MKISALLYFSVICILTGFFQNHSSKAWSAENCSASARISACATVNNPAGTLWIMNPATTEILTNSHPQLMLRLPETAEAQIILKTDRGTYKKAIDSRYLYPSGGISMGSALLMPLKSWIQNHPGAAEACTLTVVFPNN